MSQRPYTLLSCAMSIDGYLDDAGAKRLLLSCPADFDRVDALRASCDVILVGARTIRRDNPHLQVRDAVRRARRLAAGHTASPARVTLTRSGRLPADANFFLSDDAPALVYAASAALPLLRGQAGRATIVDAGTTPDVRGISEDLFRRGRRRLMVEGGGTVLTQFLLADLVDELQLVIAPVFVGDRNARRLVGEGRFPWRQDHRARLFETRRIGDVALLRYALSDRFVA